MRSGEEFFDLGDSDCLPAEASLDVLGAFFALFQLGSAVCKAEGLYSFHELVDVFIWVVDSDYVIVGFTHLIGELMSAYKLKKYAVLLTGHFFWTRVQKFVPLSRRLGNTRPTTGHTDQKIKKRIEI